MNIENPSLHVVRFPKPDDTHGYTVNGFAAPGCTEIVNVIDPFLYSNDEAMYFGKCVHQAVHYDLQGDLAEDDLSTEVMGCVEAARKFLFDHKLMPVLIEDVIGSILPLYGGTLDLLAINDKQKFWLIDWKTGGERPVTIIQLAGYAFGLMQTYRMPGAVRMAVYLRRDGNYERPEIYDNPDDFTTFKAAHQVWTWKQRHKTK